MAADNEALSWVGSITASFAAFVVCCSNELSYGPYGMPLWPLLIKSVMDWETRFNIITTSAVGSLDGPYYGLY